MVEMGALAGLGGGQVRGFHHLFSRQSSKLLGEGLPFEH